MFALLCFAADAFKPTPPPVSASRRALLQKVVPSIGLVGAAVLLDEPAAAADVLKESKILCVRSVA